jgi:hypothetical protein
MKAVETSSHKEGRTIDTVSYRKIRANVLEGLKQLEV